MIGRVCPLPPDERSRIRPGHVARTTSGLEHPVSIRRLSDCAKTGPSRGIQTVAKEVVEIGEDRPLVTEV
jgi:hypothetical protein